MDLGGGLARKFKTHRNLKLDGCLLLSSYLNLSLCFLDPLFLLGFLSRCFLLGFLRLLCLLLLELCLCHLERQFFPLSHNYCDISELCDGTASAAALLLAACARWSAAARSVAEGICARKASASLLPCSSSASRSRAWLG